MKPGAWSIPAGVAEAKEIQLQLREKVRRSGTLNEAKVRTIAGVDASISRDGSRMIGAICLLSWPDLQLQELSIASEEVLFPYLPSYLSFRELPVLLRAAGQLASAVDLALVDGQGIAHPRRFGLASHFGLMTGWRTIGCAKRRLVGEAAPPDAIRGSSSELIDRGERIGTVLRTRTDVSPVWVSIGHGVSLQEAERWVLLTSTRFRLPEPIRCAHREASRHRLSMS